MKQSAIAIFSEIVAIDHKLRAHLARVLPDDMELSHFSALNFLATQSGERTPAQLASSLNLSRGAITNTLTRLEKRGYVHIRVDWEDARKKWISLSQAGLLARNMALEAAVPMLDEFIGDDNEEEMKELLTSLRRLRSSL